MDTDQVILSHLEGLSALLIPGQDSLLLNEVQKTLVLSVVQAAYGILQGISTGVTNPESAFTAPQPRQSKTDADQLQGRIFQKTGVDDGKNVSTFATFIWQRINSETNQIEGEVSSVTRQDRAQTLANAPPLSWSMPGSRTQSSQRPLAVDFFTPPPNPAPSANSGGSSPLRTRHSSEDIMALITEGNEAARNLDHPEFELGEIAPSTLPDHQTVQTSTHLFIGPTRVLLPAKKEKRTPTGPAAWEAEQAAIVKEKAHNSTAERKRRRQNALSDKRKSDLQGCAILRANVIGKIGGVTAIGRVIQGRRRDGGDK
ncbi:MAG: hypothetical protein Q9220_002289 [cf. Caloplaca sp. 1 TL-2023]